LHHRWLGKLPCDLTCSLRNLNMRNFFRLGLEVLLGFLALAFFAFLAFGPQPPSDGRFVLAFKAAAPVALAEVAFLLWRPAPVNRLIFGANLWLIAGGFAAYTQQWWWLRAYQQFGEASLFIAMLLVGIITASFSKTGFVGANGARQKVLRASLALLAAVLLSLFAAIYFRGDVKLAAVVPVIALSWFNRLLRRWAAGAGTT
jgi:hypothetical protein